MQTALGWDYQSELSKHQSQTDAAKGFGGRYGVQKERKDKVREPYFSLPPFLFIALSVCLYLYFHLCYSLSVYLFFSLFLFDSVTVFLFLLVSVCLCSRRTIFNNHSLNLVYLNFSFSLSSCLSISHTYIPHMYIL